MPQATGAAKQNDVQPAMVAECHAAANHESCRVDHPQMRPAPFDSPVDTAVAHSDVDISVPPSVGLSVYNRTDGCRVAILTRTTLDGYAANSPHSRSAQTAASGAGSAGNNGTSEADRPVPLLESASGEITFFS